MIIVSRYPAKIFISVNIGLILVGIFLWLQAYRHDLTWRADFTIFYTAARIIASDKSHQLYNLEIQKSQQAEILGNRSFADGLLPFNYPPHLAVLLKPLSLLDLRHAYLLWTLLQLLMVTILCYQLCRLTIYWNINERILLILITLALPFTFLNFLLGSLSLFLLIVTLKFYEAIKDGNKLMCVIALLLTTIKPQYSLFPAVAMICSSDRNSLSVMTLLILIIAIYSSVLLGSNIWVDYAGLAYQCSGFFDQYGVYPAKMINLKAILTAAIGSDKSNLINMVVVLALIAGLIYFLLIFRKSEKRADSDQIKCALAICFSLSVFLSPHSNPQDALLLVAPALIIYDLLRKRVSISYISGYLALFCQILLSIIILGADKGFSFQPAGILSLTMVILSITLSIRIKPAAK